MDARQSIQAPCILEECVWNSGYKQLGVDGICGEGSIWQEQTAGGGEGTQAAPLSQLLSLLHVHISAWYKGERLARPSPTPLTPSARPLPSIPSPSHLHPSGWIFPALNAQAAVEGVCSGAGCLSSMCLAFPLPCSSPQAMQGTGAPHRPHPFPQAPHGHVASSARH